MPVEIKNLTFRPVLIRLNSGASLHLSPGVTSFEIVDEEIIRNAKVQKLQEQRIITLTESKHKLQKAEVPQARVDRARK
ncbi:MAG TPA: hypothetical protein PKD12_02140 [Nitrospira sp.]|nr:hypothetical protein [Nitrospira sp.]